MDARHPHCGHGYVPLKCGGMSLREIIIIIIIMTLFHEDNILSYYALI